MKLFSGNFIFITLVMLSVNHLPAQEVNGLVTSGNTAFSLATNYVWRGLKLSESWVSQPTVGIHYNKFSVNMWMNYDLDLKEVTETDLTIDYGMDYDLISINVGYINYALDGIADTQEFFFTSSFQAPLNPELEFYWDINEGKGLFIITTISHSFLLFKDYFLHTGALASFNMDNAVMGMNTQGESFSNFYHGELNISIDVPIDQHFSLTTFTAYSFPLSSEAESAIQTSSIGNKTTNLYGSITFSLNI